MLNLDSLTGARIRVRPLRADDLDACDALFVDIGWADPSTPPADRRRQRADWLRWTIDSYREQAALYQPPYGERAIERIADGRVLGLAGLVPSLIPRPDGRRQPEMGLFWALSPAHQHQGFATEAGQLLIDWTFARLRPERIVATTESDNETSIAVMRRLGMTIEQIVPPPAEGPDIVGRLES